MAAYIMTKGYPLLGTSINRETKLMVYLFEDIEAIRNCMKNYNNDIEYQKMCNKQY